MQLWGLGIFGWIIWAVLEVESLVWPSKALNDKALTILAFYSKKGLCANGFCHFASERGCNVFFYVYVIGVPI